MAEVVTERKHRHHAESKALHGELRLPLKQIIEPQAVTTLKPEGGYLSQHAEPFRIEGVVSFTSAYTQVSGNPDVKPGHGWSTVATSVVENLNILEVVTADRIVSQIFCEYPLEGYVPAISFLGTRFENLRIAGHLVDLKLDLDIFGDKPGGDLHYTSEPDFLGRAKTQCGHICSFDTLPAASRSRYEPYSHGPVKNNGSEIVECSLVNQAAGSFPGKSFGHVIHIPHFGTVYLATVKVTHEDFHNGVPHKTTVELLMVDAQMGCIGDGGVGAGGTKTNGGTKP